jgi:hypothetical protein
LPRGETGPAFRPSSLKLRRANVSEAAEALAKAASLMRATGLCPSYAHELIARLSDCFRRISAQSS